MVKGCTQALAQLVDDGLGEQGHGHLPLADMKIERACLLPAQVLIETEELLNVPPIRKIFSQGGHFLARRSAGEGLEVIIFRPFYRTLNIAVQRFSGSGAAGGKSFGGDGKTGPMTDEAFRRQSSTMILESLGMTQGDQQIKNRVFSDVVIQQFHCEVLNIGDDEGALALFRTGEDLLLCNDN